MRHVPRTLSLLALSLLSLSCLPRPDGKSDSPNVLLVSIDTLRADHLGIYGYPADTSPHLDALSEEAVVFDEAIAHAPSTLPSHASLFTSLLPHQHGAIFTLDQALPDRATTLAEVFRGGGYRTASINGGGQLRPRFGLDQGFDYSQIETGSFADTVRRALTWLDAIGDQPFFLFLHTYEVHHPYQPRAELLEAFDRGYAGSLPDEISIELLRSINSGEKSVDEADVAHIVSAYDAEIRSMDQALGELIGALKERGLYRDLVIVFTSDHGEEFAEHGKVGWHSHTLFDELLRVPLVIRFPEGRFAGLRVSEQVRLIDVAPTVLGLTGLDSPAEFLGLDLADLIRGREQAQMPAISLRERDARGGRLGSIRYRNWKWANGRLYDLRDDPGELTDLARSHASKAGALKAELELLVEARPRLDRETVKLDQDDVNALRALGYVEEPR